MSPFINILNKKFGKLTAIERISDGPFGKWKFKCDCGKEKIISKQNVTQGKVNSCGCLNRFSPLKDRHRLEGKKFGRLTVIRHNVEDSRTKSTYWDCLCDCGKTVTVKGVYLVSKHTRSCGCIKIYRLDKGESGLNIVYKQYIRHAKGRSKEFNLSKEKFKEITQQNCFYCGKEPSSSVKCKSEHSRYVYNGIDRVDSDKGYTLDNVVPCCGTCNRIKMETPLEEFKKNIKRIHDNLSQKGWTPL
jgi:hypothetical protein